LPVEQLRAWVGTGQTATALATILAGNDRIAGSPFADYLLGHAGSDQIDLGGGDDTALGGPGNDVINCRSGIDSVGLAGTAADYQLVVWNGNVGAVPRSGAILAAEGIDKAFGVETLTFLSSGENVQVGSDNFSPPNYAASYDDLMQSFGTNEAAAFDHYIYAGAYEARSVSFSGFEYLASQPDLETASAPAEILPRRRTTSLRVASRVARLSSTVSNTSRSSRGALANVAVGTPSTPSNTSPTMAICAQPSAPTRRPPPSTKSATALERSRPTSRSAKICFPLPLQPDTSAVTDLTRRGACCSGSRAARASLVVDKGSTSR
jgi:RTX calcium-binding nonapeptide repeat (4 copies)